MARKPKAVPNFILAAPNCVLLVPVPVAALLQFNSQEHTMLRTAIFISPISTMALTQLHTRLPEEQSRLALEVIQGDSAARYLTTVDEAASSDVWARARKFC